MAKKTDKTKEASFRLAVLPLKDMVVFPSMVVPLLVGRPASLEAVSVALEEGEPIFLCTQKSAEEEEPRARDMHRIGVAANILQTLRMPDGTMKIVVEALGRGQAKRFYFNSFPAEADVVKVTSSAVEEEKEIQGKIRAVFAQFETYGQESQRVAPEIINSLRGSTEAELFADTVCAYLAVPAEERQALLAELDLSKRLNKITAILMRENELLGIERSVRDRVRDQMERTQREHYLHEQLKAIHQELGGREDGMSNDYGELREQIEKTKMPKKVRDKADKEYARYERMPVMSPESGVIRTYLEWLCDYPWQKRTKDAIQLDEAQRVLDEDHYGLVKVKERILEFLAVRKLRKKAKGPILCLVGPPGVGKTSLGQSIARAMRRKFVRISLGGVRDEAEIRGHRRTYIGAMPGRIIQSLKKTGVSNPLFMLDEIDKMNADFRGDPASALLEVLDPAQNKAFSDHYMEVDTDLSEVFFICTANSEYDIPHALHDRMEIVRLPGYTQLEKERIATLFLIPRQIEESGLENKHVTFTDAGLDVIIQCYTREAGVRELERQISTICRKAARQLVAGTLKKTLKVTAESAVDLLGPPPYTALEKHAKGQAGVAVGLAWTQSGGDVLSIETTTMPGKGVLSLTGQLGDVMKESAEAAYTYLRAHAKSLGVPADFYKKTDIHVHIPEGAIPKDGPSAGVTLLTSLLSALRNQAPKNALAMTGEITLRGRVLPVGGIKEKVIAAHRAGIRHILMPKENEKDFPDIPDEVRAAVKFTLVEHVDAVLKIALPKPVRRKKKTA